MAAPDVEEDVVCDDDGGAAWYAAAAAGEGDDEDLVEDYEVEDVEEGDAAKVSDPYLVVGADEDSAADDPYLVAAGAAEADPYLAEAFEEAAPDVATPAAAEAVPVLAPAAQEKRPLDAEVGAPRKVQRTQGPAQQSGTPGPLAHPRLLEQVKLQQPSRLAAPPAPPMPAIPAEVSGGALPPVPAAPVAAALPSFKGDPGEEIDISAFAPPTIPKELLAEDIEALVPDPSEVEEAAEGDDELGDTSWDERVVVVRQGQVHIELMHRSPPMPDESLLKFCDWLDEQMPLVVQNFPYVRNSGAYIDLSDNSIGPEGLGGLFRVLRDHRVPCLVMKAYRNCLDDSIVDTLIEYLYTQPESFPMHGIHISHNKISDKGAMRLIRAAAQCGHYPRLTSRLPLWLRLECNDIQNPQKVVADCLQEGFNVCLMADGLCSRPNCNHYSGVHVQLPYFYNQHGKGDSGRGRPRVKVPPATAPSAPRPPPLVKEDSSGPPATPDWMLQNPRPSHSTNSGVLLMQAAPKRVPVHPSAAPAASAPFSTGCGGGEHSIFAPPPQAPPPNRSTFRARDFGGDQPSGREPPWRRNLVPPGGGGGDFGGACGGGACGGQPPSHDGGGFGAGGGCGKHGGGGGWGNGGGGWGKDGGKDGGGGGWGKGGGGWGKDGGKDAGKGGGGKGGKGKGGGGKGQMWQGLTLVQKVKHDIKLTEADSALGFTWRMVGDGRAPQVISVDYGSTVSQAAEVGRQLLRVNGLDTSMFSEKQITDMLRQRPISLRFGDQ